ncbi:MULTISPECIES: IS4 family transposase [unclassified Mesorhizobium]|uniref:IS4 family transposase n=2 Tax=Mesorhizobium TaxID=68287 RepID=UPI0015E3DFA2|nr:MULTISPECIES: IS4 family transposase [unclassified Mesorhizobium]UCI29228.1 IS4 family transposase [Mesorhizobium sp. B4-1-4]UCI30781.1 IS4 family transposase [Mesorhizobium sp. B4-1-4]UCI31285.1 IS4 family transposase [Mesorhizobium sp. B4-1-4]UCI34237.1 IS4 family transposase [Mesorhizobium sp. B4-1-4]UCI34434.1 IS4 family transposase [Mesorhizobium sp. B4-1-4]
MRISAGMRRLADTRAEQVAFTRLFGNPNVTVQEIVRTAAAQTAKAAAGRHVLIIEDSSEINYQAKASRKRGLGCVGNGKDIGLFVHPALAVDAGDGSVLGLAAATIWRRRGQKADDYQALPIEAKESYKWIATATAARQALTDTPLLTVIGDREADIYEVLARLPDERTHVLMRAVRDRALGEEGGRLFGEIAKTPEAGRIAFDLQARPGRPGRKVHLAVRFAEVTLRQPRLGADRRDPRAVRLNIVEVREIDPPSPKDAVIWRLLTTHTVKTLADAIAIVDLYRSRWTIEQLFRTLKSQAIDLEESLIADGDALERLAATALIVATRVMQLVHGRDAAGQTLRATRLFNPAEIAVLDALVARLEGKTQTQKNPHPPHTLAWAAWCIARLGGWNGYPKERPPGPVTFSNGLKRFHAIVEGFVLANPY